MTSKANQSRGMTASSRNRVDFINQGRSFRHMSKATVIDRRTLPPVLVWDGSDHSEKNKKEWNGFCDRVDEALLPLQKLHWRVCVVYVASILLMLGTFGLAYSCLMMGSSHGWSYFIFFVVALAIDFIVVVACGKYVLRSTKHHFNRVHQICQQTSSEKRFVSSSDQPCNVGIYLRIEQVPVTSDDGDDHGTNARITDIYFIELVVDSLEP